MTVARADANGVNPGTALAVGPDGQRATPKTGGGSASSPGGTLPDAPAQRGRAVRGPQAAGGPAETIRTDRIEKTIDRLIVAEGNMRPIRQRKIRRR
jgi:hypothetical protein